MRWRFSVLVLRGFLSAFPTLMSAAFRGNGLAWCHSRLSFDFSFFHSRGRCHLTRATLPIILARTLALFWQPFEPKQKHVRSVARAHLQSLSGHLPKRACSLQVSLIVLFAVLGTPGGGISGSSHLPSSIFSTTHSIFRLSPRQTFFNFNKLELNSRHQTFCNNTHITRNFHRLTSHQFSFNISHE